MEREGERKATGREEEGREVREKEKGREGREGRGEK
jgi:hypothetical protein